VIDVARIDEDVLEPPRESDAVHAVKHRGLHPSARDPKAEAQRPELEVFVTGDVLGPDDRAAWAIIVMGEP